MSLPARLSALSLSRKQGVVPVAAAAAATSMSIVSGQSQSATVNTQLSVPLVIQVLDQNSNPFAGRTVTAAVNSGAGSITPASAVTDANGRASFTASVGAVAGFNSFTVTSAGLAGSPLVFTATGVAVQVGLWRANEPSNFVQARLIDFSQTVPADNQTSGGLTMFTGTDRLGSVITASRLTSDGPRGGFMWRAPYPALFDNQGSAPMRFLDALLPANVGTMYVSLAHRFSPNFCFGNPTGTMNVSCKFLFFKDGSFDSQNNHCLNMYNRNTTPPSCNWVWENQGTNNNITPFQYGAGATPQIFDGQWHIYEWLLTANTPGVSNGRVQTWIDGAPIADNAAWQFFGAGQTPLWRNLWFDHTYGGGSVDPYQDMYRDWDEVYVSFPP